VRRALPIAIIALSLAAATAGAGRRDTIPFVVDAANGHASGSLGDTREDPDPHAYLRCEVVSAPGASSFANCFACNVKECVGGWSYDPEIVDTVRSLSSNGALAFFWTTPSLELTSISVYTGSQYTPVQP
jgi:hypothetical protein